MAETPTPESVEPAQTPALSPEASTAPAPLATRRMVRGMSMGRRWLRDTFAREQLIAGLKQLAWVAPATLLIWFYAEREQQVPGEVRFALEVRTTNRSAVVRLREPSDGYISLAVEGPFASLEKLRGALGPRMIPVRFDVPPDLKEGPHQFDVTEIVGRDPRFDGLTIKNSEPSRIEVAIDPVVEVAVPVQVREEDKPLFEQVTFNPPKVKVTLPADVKDRAEKDNGPLVAYADLSTLPDMSPGRKPDVAGIRVAVATSDPDSVDIQPQTVSASLVVRERAKAYTLKELTVLESVATRLRDNVTVEMPQINLFDVVISGPPEVIDAIAANNGAGVTAHVDIDTDDIDKGPVRKQPWFNLPAGAKVVSYSPKEGVEITVTRDPK